MTIPLVESEEKILNILRRITLFDSLDLEELEHLCHLVSIKKAGIDEVIFKQGDPPDALYIIESGKVEIILEIGEKSEEIATLGRSGDFFGEMALIEDTPRSATVRALTDVQLLMITQSDFTELIAHYPSIQKEVARVLSHNLRQSDTRFAESILEKSRQLAKALEELKAAQEELLRKERLSMVGRLASGIIHDLKKPLTCISGYSQLLGSAALNENRRQQYCQKITSEVQRLVEMINEILDFSRGEQQIARKRVSIKTWLKDINRILRQDLEGSGIELKTSKKAAGYVNIDLDKFERVFYNITANALTAMPKGGIFQFICQKQGQRVRMDFRDNGIGMTEEVKRRVFEEFFSQHKTGTGLGMAIAKSIVEAHEGTIEVQSELGKGTCFTIWLPLESP